MVGDSVAGSGGNGEVGSIIGGFISSSKIDPL